FHPLSIIFNAEEWKALPEEYQEVVQRAVDRASEEHLELLQEANEKALAELETQGVEIIELDDRERWAESVRDAADDFSDTYADTGQMITDAMQAAGNGGE